VYVCVCVCVWVWYLQCRYERGIYNVGADALVFMLGTYVE